MLNQQGLGKLNRRRFRQWWWWLLAVSGFFGLFGGGDTMLGAIILLLTALLLLIIPCKEKRLSFIEEENERLESIKHIVIKGATSDSALHPFQIKQALELYIDQRLKKYKDCIELVNNTVNPKVFFDRYDLLQSTLEELVLVEHCYSTTVLPSSELNRIVSQRADMTSMMVDRLWEKTIDKAKLLSTSKGKENKYDTFFRNIAVYQDRMPDESWDHFQKIKQVYLDNKDSMIQVIQIEDI